MQRIINIQTTKAEELVDITDQIKELVLESGVMIGLVNIYVQGATAAIMIQENWDEAVQRDVISLLKGLIPKGVWEHDKNDTNGDSHIKSGLVGPSETVPIINGFLGLNSWQNIFLCEFDGPKPARPVVVTIIETTR